MWEDAAGVDLTWFRQGESSRAAKTGYSPTIARRGSEIARRRQADLQIVDASTQRFQLEDARIVEAQLRQWDPSLRANRTEPSPMTALYAINPAPPRRHDEPMSRSGRKNRCHGNRHCESEGATKHIRDAMKFSQNDSQSSWHERVIY